MSGKEGQGASQPAEGVQSLDDLLALDGVGEGGDEALDELEGEESDESEAVETEEEEADDTEQEEAEEPVFTVKHDGKEITLKQSELVEMAQKGFDYTQKTMAVAEERKAVESAKAQAEQHRQQYEAALNEQVDRLQALELFIQSQLGSPPPIEWAQQDAAYYLAQKELYENRRGQLEQARQSIHYLQSEQQRSRQAWIAEQAEATEKALRDTLPGWNDDTLDDYAKYAAGLGLTPDKADVAYVQKGFWELIHKAKQYDALQAKKAEIKPVEKPLAKVAKPGNNNQPPQLARRQEAFKRHKAAPTLATLAALD